MLWNQVDALQKHFKKDHVHMRLWTRLYGIVLQIVPKNDNQTFSINVFQIVN